jgi:uncharacterized protein
MERRAGLQGSRHLPGDHPAFVTSIVTRIEVARTLRRDEADANVDREVEESLMGIDSLSVSESVVAVACRLPMRQLKSLDAIHVATALITRSDVVLTRDRQMARACEELGLAVA